MTLKGGTSQACGACKYQRRKCTRDCPLAPYFPPDQPNMFQNAHRLFGVSNILKILKPLDPSQKMEAMRSIIFQSNMRQRFPVQGCFGIIRQLHYQILQSEEELRAVHTLLAQHEMSSMPDDSASRLQLGMALPGNAQSYNAVAALPIIESQICNNVGYNIESKDNVVNSLWVQEASQDYDEMKLFFDDVDDRQSYIDSKEAYESSLESSLKDTTQSIEHVAENELKSAAACFSLTSVN